MVTRMLDHVENTIRGGSFLTGTDCPTFKACSTDSIAWSRSRDMVDGPPTTIV
jgi:hypothetical protein